MLVSAELVVLLRLGDLRGSALLLFKMSLFVHGSFSALLNLESLLLVDGGEMCFLSLIITLKELEHVRVMMKDIIQLSHELAQVWLQTLVNILFPAYQVLNVYLLVVVAGIMGATDRRNVLIHKIDSGRLVRVVSA